MAKYVAIAALLTAGLAALPRGAADPSAPEESAMTRYAVAVRSKVESALQSVPWQDQGPCSVELIQLPGGMVVHVTLLRCAFPEPLQARVAAKLESVTLPYAGFERVFQRRIVINLKQAPQSG